jgi:hypothetical protein
VAAPEGNPIYVKYLANGEPYLCCNMATTTADKWVTFGTNYKVLVQHDANAAVGSVQLYFDEDATQPSRLLAALARLKTAYIPTNNPSYFLQITYNVAPATPGVAINYDDVTHLQLEFISPTTAAGVLDLASFAPVPAPAWSWKTIGGSKGQLYSQGAYGDAKLMAGAKWDNGANGGSRSRVAMASRWTTPTNGGGRFAAEPA